MGVSTEYGLESKETFLNILEDLSQTIEGDTVVKAVNIMIKFQTRQAGSIWGETVNDKTETVQKVYLINLSNIPSDAKLFDELKASQKKSENNLFSELGLESIKEMVELFYAVELDKYPTLLTNLCQIVREMKDEELFDLIKGYQKFVTSTLPDDNQEKIQAKALSELTITSAAAQALLFVVRQKLNEGSSKELYSQGRAYLVHVKPFLIQCLEQEYKKTKELEEALQLPLDSERVQQLIAPLRDKMLKKHQEDELRKVATCYKEALWKMQRTVGEKQFVSVDVKVVYAKQSNLDQELVYVKRFP